MGAKGGDSDWYGYCVDDPVNRVDAWGLEDSWWDDTAEGRILKGGVKGAGTGAIGGAVAGSPTGVGAPLGALVGGLMGFPSGLLKATVWEALTKGSGANVGQPSDDVQEQRKTLEEWWRSK